MKKMIAVLTLCAGCSAVLADPIVYDNGAASGVNSYSSQLDTVFPFDSQTADDFFIPTNPNGDNSPTLITDVHWAGTYFNPGPPGNATAFNINFYFDAGGMPTGAGPVDPTPTAFASYSIPFAMVNETPIPGTADFTYDVTLPSPVTVLKNTIYWLGIQEVGNFPPQWGWATSVQQQGFDAVQGFPLLGVNYWSDPDQDPTTHEDMAFYLTGHKIPTPGALALLGLGGLVAGRRRR